MRNLKKFLALALAVMMTFSLMVTANAITTDAAVTDRDSITDEFKEAVAVLNGLGIITGYEDGTFRPEKPITRQETTALVYRLHSGDVKDTKNDLYSTADNIKQFTDVKADGGQKWSAGYIGYCANQGIIKGVSDTRFAPTHEVTGYQVLAMVLRAIGYGQNKEYEGSGWQTRVATTATQLGILKNVNNTNYAATLSGSATRELVAEIIFQAALQDTVTYTAGLGYVKTGSTSLVGGTLGSLSTKNFNLKSGNYQVIDDWGRPGYKWYSGDTAIATITATPAKEYDTAVRECDVAHDLGFDGSRTYSLFVNSKTVTAANYTIQATDTVTKVGGQGRITEFYAKLTNPHNGSTWPASVVMIDTYLAKVTGVTAPVLDKAGHVIVPAKLDLDVYDGPMSYGTVTTGIGTNNPVDVTDTDGQGKFPSKHVATQNTAFEYVVGDMLLVRGYTDYTQYYDNKGNKTDYDNAAAANKNETGLNHTISAEALEKTAFETNVLKASDDEAKISIVGKADMKLGKQTKTYYNDNKHNVDSNDYNDQLTLFLDRAKTDTKVTWAWYFDAKGNLIGIDEAPTTTQYGVITSIYAAFNQGDNYTDGTTKAVAKVKMADGSEQTIVIDRFLMSSADGAAGRLDVAANNKATDGTKLLKDTTDAVATTGTTIELIPMYDYNDAGQNKVMKVDALTNVTAYNAAQKANIYMAPVASVNELRESTWTNKSSSGYYGIIRGNMFKFVNTQYGMTAVEVAGPYADSHTNENTGIYEWQYNNIAVSTDSPKLTKTLGLLKVNASKTITVGNNTKIMVRSSDGDGKTITCYNGLSALPGDIDIKGDSEVDWVDFNGDGRVDYVYLTGRVNGTVTYGLFYYNGGAAIWDGANGTGTLTGWLNGEATTVTFDDQKMFNDIKDHTSNVDTLNYRAHLFALQINNGVVSDVMNEATNNGIYLLADSSANPANTANAKVEIAALAKDGTKDTQTDKIETSDGSDLFGLGGLSAKWGNPYDEKTGIVYLQDEDNKADVTYSPTTSTVVHKNTDTYYVTESSKIIGLGRGVTYGENVLYYLNECDKNDVTIVFDNSTGNKVILEIYVATDPDWTPNGTDPVVASKPVAGPNLVVLPKPASEPTTPDAQLQALIKSVRNTAIYTTGGIYASVDDVGTSDVLWFPYGSPGANVPVGLVIYDSNNVPVCTMTGTSDAGSTKSNFLYMTTGGVGADWTDPGAIYSGSLKAGVYTFVITNKTTQDVLSQGTFTMQ